MFGQEGEIGSVRWGLNYSHAYQFSTSLGLSLLKALGRNSCLVMGLKAVLFFLSYQKESETVIFSHLAFLLFNLGHLQKSPGECFKNISALEILT